MSVYRRMLGRGLPCCLGELIDLPPAEPRIRTDAACATASGMEHLKAGRLGLARRDLTEAIRNDPDDLAAALALALTHEALCEHAQAARCIDAALTRRDAAVTGRRSRLLCAAGLELERVGDWRKAERRYIEAVNEDPTDALAHHRLVAIYLSHARLPQAALHLKGLLAWDAAHTEARVCLGHLLQRAGRCTDALKQYEQALAVEPEGLEGFIADAATALSAGDSDAAAEHLRRAVEANDLTVELYAGLAMSLESAGRAAQASQVLCGAVRLNDNATVLMARARLLERGCADGQELADDDEAARVLTLPADHLRRLIEEDLATLARHGGWTDVLIEHGRMLRLAGRRAEASRVLAAARQQAGSPAAALQHGLALFDMGRVKQAAGAFREALSLNVRQMQLYYRLALACCDEAEFDLTARELALAADDEEDLWHRLGAAVKELAMDRGRSPAVRPQGRAGRISGSRSANQ